MQGFGFVAVVGSEMFGYVFILERDFKKHGILEY